MELLMKRLLELYMKLLPLNNEIDHQIVSLDTRIEALQMLGVDCMRHRDLLQSLQALKQENMKVTVQLYNMV